MTIYHIKVKDQTGDVERFTSYEPPEIDEETGELIIYADGTVTYNMNRVIYYSVFETQEREDKARAYEHNSIQM